MQEKKHNLFNVKSDKFWNFVSGEGSNPPELVLYGPISSTDSWWEDRVTPKKFNDELAEIGEADEIVVRINSGGGDVFAANAIYTRLKDCSAKITVKIDGWSASAATIIAMAGDTIKIARNGVFMIHDPEMAVCDYYSAKELEKLTDELKVIKQSIVNCYAQKTGKSEDEIAEFMSEETWWTGEEAVENGFCDELMFEAVETTVENSNCFIVNSANIDLKSYRTIPKSILNTVKVKEERKLEEKKITTMEELRNAYPELVRKIENSAVESERKRIKEIKDMALDGYEDIIEDAMFNKPVKAEKVAMMIINRQKEIGGNYLNNREDDIKNSGVNNVGIEAKEQGGEVKNVFEAALDKLYPETK